MVWAKSAPSLSREQKRADYIVVGPSAPRCRRYEVFRNIQRPPFGLAGRPPSRRYGIQRPVRTECPPPALSTIRPLIADIVKTLLSEGKPADPQPPLRKPDAASNVFELQLLGNQLPGLVFSPRAYLDPARTNLYLAEKRSCSRLRTRERRGFQGPLDSGWPAPANDQKCGCSHHGEISAASLSRQACRSPVTPFGVLGGCGEHPGSDPEGIEGLASTLPLREKAIDAAVHADGLVAWCCLDRRPRSAASINVWA